MANIEKKEKCDFKKLPTQTPSRKRFERTYTVDEDFSSDELNDPESLKEIIIHLSNEYDEFKEKHNNLLNTVSEKEKQIQELSTSLKLKEDEIQVLRERNSKLNFKLKDYEFELEEMEKNEINIEIAKNKKAKTASFQKLENSDDEYEMTKLREEISEKEIEIETTKINFDQKLRQCEEKYQNYINELQNEIRKFQDTLNNRNEYDTQLKNQLCQIDENREILEKKNIVLQNELQNLQNYRKVDKLNHDIEREKLTTEVNALKKILDEKNNFLKEFEELTIKQNKTSCELSQLKICLSTKDQNLQKFDYMVKQLQMEIQSRENEKKNILIEYDELKNELLNMGNNSKDANRLIEEFRVEKNNMNLNFEKEKAEYQSEIEKMKKVIENLNSKLEIYKTNNRESDTKNSLVEKGNNKPQFTIQNFVKAKTSEVYSHNLIENSFINKMADVQFLTLGEALNDRNPNCFTLQDCISDEEDNTLITDSPMKKPLINDENKLNQLQNTQKNLKIEIEVKDKLIQNYISQLEELSNKIENFTIQNFELKSLLENERFDRQNDLTNFKLRMKKLREYIQKQELALALKSINQYG